MKCPKCGYLGFETVDRCRNCGYDFSLASPPPLSTELPLNEGRGAGAALADLDLTPSADKSSRQSPDLDLDRLIGVESAAAEAAAARVPDDPEPAYTAEQSPAAEEALPLFQSEEMPDEPPPIVAPPRPVGPPLAVRRASPEVPRGRSRGPRPPRRAAPPLIADTDPEDTFADPHTRTVIRPQPGAPAAPEAAPRRARLTAAAIDVLLLGGINAAVLYLTLRMTDLAVADIARLPVVPMAAFLMLLDGGYMAALTAAGGKTIGKMATGIRVIGDDGRAVDASGAVLRAVGGLVTVLALGLPYIPVLVADDGRALADRLAGTRVVRGD